MKRLGAIMSVAVTAMIVILLTNKSVWSDALIVNGNFETDISGWSTSNAPGTDPDVRWHPANGPDSQPGVMFINDVAGIVPWAEQTIMSHRQLKVVAAPNEVIRLFVGPQGSPDHAVRPGGL